MRKNSLITLSLFILFIITIALLIYVETQYVYADEIHEDEIESIIVSNSEIDESKMFIDSVVRIGDEQDVLKIIVRVENYKYNSIGDFQIESTFLALKINSEREGLVLYATCNNGYNKLSIYEKASSIGCELYAIKNEYGTYFSKESYEDAYGNCLREAVNNNYLTNDEAKKAMNYFKSKAKANTAKGSDEDTYATGALKWVDDGGRQHPLRWVKVVLFDANAIGGDTLLGEAITGLNGTFYIAFHNNDTIFDNWGSDLYIKVYAGDNNTFVVNLAGVKYVKETPRDSYQNVETGSTTTIAMSPIPMVDDDGKAMQISQALLTAKHFVWNETGVEPNAVTAEYPSDFEYWGYDYVNSVIRLPHETKQDAGLVNDYASWDALMHEYGHHVESGLGYTFDVIKDHYFNFNLSEVNNSNKRKGTRVAWAEAWASAFAMIAQREFYIQNAITSVSDSSFSHFGMDIDIETFIDNNSLTPYICEGEDCEEAVLAVLWDLYDDDNESNDNITLGPSNWWNITTNIVFENFSDFAQYFYSTRPEQINQLAPNLEYYKIAAQNTRALNGTQISSIQPTFAWDDDNGVENCFNMFDCIIEGGSSLEFIRVNSILNPEYTLTSEQWETIKAWSSEYFYLTVISYQTNWPQTGGYYSTKKSFRKPKFLASLTINDTLTIDGLFDLSITDVVVPQTIDSKLVSGISSNAFAGLSIRTIIIGDNISYIGNNAFDDCNNLTIYSSRFSGSWDSNWNPDNRPFVWNCLLSSDSSQVISFEKDIVNPWPGYNGTINNPTRSGYTFGGWYTSSDYSGTSYSTIMSAPNGMLYAKWNSNSSGSCITTGSLITLADGTQTAVENLTGNEQLLVWDMLNGTFTSAPILFIDSEITTTYDVITLTFSDGTQVEVIDEHAFFDTTLNKYVFLRSDAAQYIGHYFKKQSYDINNNMTLVNVQLIDVSISQQVTTAYSPVTYGHLCYYVNGMLSMPGNTESFINIFDVNSTTMAYDQTSMAQDISTYGLYTYEEFSSIISIPELVFNAFNGQYLKVAIGKGITTLQEIQNLLNRYMSFFE